MKEKGAFHVPEIIYDNRKTQERKVNTIVYQKPHFQKHQVAGV